MALATTRMFKTKDEARLRVAAHYAGVNIKEVLFIGEDLNVQLTYRNTDTLIKLGEYFGTVTGKEILPKEKSKPLQDSRKNK